MTKPTYTLKQARFYYGPDDIERLSGHVFGHPKFQDGEVIFTSEVIGFFARDSLVETLHSFYNIGGWDNGEKEESFTEEEVRALFERLQKSFRGTDIRQCP